MLMPDERNSANFSDLPRCRRILPCAGGSHMLMPDARNNARQMEVPNAGSQLLLGTTLGRWQHVAHAQSQFEWQPFLPSPHYMVSLHHYLTCPYLLYARGTLYRGTYRRLLITIGYDSGTLAACGARTESRLVATIVVIPLLHNFTVSQTHMLMHNAHNTANRADVLAAGKQVPWGDLEC